MELYLHSVYVFTLMFVFEIRDEQAKPDHGVCIQVNVITQFE